jgi:hypothetical protein
MEYTLSSAEQQSREQQRQDFLRLWGLTPTRKRITNYYHHDSAQSLHNTPPATMNEPPLYVDAAAAAMLPLVKASALSLINQAISKSNDAATLIGRGESGQAVSLLSTSMMLLESSASLIRHYSGVNHYSPLPPWWQEERPRKRIRCFPHQVDGGKVDGKGQTGTRKTTADSNSSGDFDCCDWVFFLNWDHEANDAAADSLVAVQEIKIFISCISAAVAYNFAFAFREQRVSMGLHGHHMELSLLSLSLHLLENVDVHFLSDLLLPWARDPRATVDGVATSVATICSPKDWSQVHVAVLNNIGHICSVLFDWECINCVIQKMGIHLMIQYGLEMFSSQSAEDGGFAGLEDTSGPIGLLSLLNDVVSSPNGCRRTGFFHSPAA